MKSKHQRTNFAGHNVRVDHILFGFFASMILAGTLIANLSTIIVDYPSWTGIGVSKSNLERRNYSVFPTFETQLFENGELQSQADKYFSDHIPLRDATLLTFAHMQRILIEIASMPLHYDVAPTFYDSSYSCCTSNGRLYIQPVKRNSEEIQNSITTFCQNINAVESSASQMNVTCFLAEWIGASENNPLSKTSTDSLTHAELINRVHEKLDDNIQLVDSAYNESQFAEYYFKTDLHWNMDGAYEGYRLIANALGISELVSKGSPYTCAYPSFFGDFARRGLYLGTTDDRVVDYRFDIPNYKVTVDDRLEGGNELLASLTPSNFASFSFNPNKLAGRYGEMFPARENGLSVIDNPSCETGRTLLILGDSFARPIDRLLAAHYSRTVLYNPRERRGSTLSEMIKNYNPDDTLILLSTRSLIEISDYIDAIR